MTILLFLDLPVEIQLLIKKAIPISDLRTHVHFYHASPHCANLYDLEQDAETFWMHACWSCGIGALDNDYSSWRDIAFECIRVDESCSHPQCGISLLEYNRQRMLAAEEYVAPRESLWVDENTDVRLEMHRVFSHISFRPPNEVGPFNRVPVAMDVFLRQDETSERVEGRTYLSQHPLLRRSFATSIPVRRMLLLSIIGDAYCPEHRINILRPITVLDVLMSVQAHLDEELTVRDALEHITYHDTCFETLSTKAAFAKMLSVRHALTVCPIEGISHQENMESGPAFEFFLR